MSLDERGKVLYRSEVAALAEGFCPVHAITLEAVTTPARWIAGHCTPCGKFWGYSRDDERVGWWLDHCPVPAWMGRWPQ